MAGPTTWRPLIAAGVRTVAGVNESLTYPPSGLPEPLPLAFLGEARAPVTMGQRERWQWTVPLTLIVARKADYGQELAATEAFIEPLMAWFRANITLGGLATSLAVTEVREGTATLADTEHVAVTFVLLVSEASAQTLSG